MKKTVFLTLSLFPLNAGGAQGAAEVLKKSGVERPCSSGEVQGAGIGFDDRSIARARRSGDAESRVYVLTYSAQDSAGNEATQQVSVVTPHDQR